MKRTKFVASVLLLAALLLSLAAIPAAAAGYETVIDDRMELLSDYEEANIISLFDPLCRRYGFEMRIVTTNDYDPRYGTSPEGLDPYYDELGMGAEGLLFLISFGAYENQYFLENGTGTVVSFDYGTRDYILDVMYDAMANHNYARACSLLSYELGEYLEARENGTDYPPSPPKTVDPVWVITAIVVGIIVALIVTGKMKAKLKTVRAQDRADNYLRRDSLVLTRESDFFLYRTVSRTAKPKNNSSSGHSSSNSSGRGGGRSF